jgi:hypothetical protein
MIHVKGIEIVDDETVPDGEIWIMCPMANGGKVRYMFNLTDHRMTQPGAEQCFFLDLEKWLLELEQGMQGTEELDLSLGRLGLILEAMKDFKTGKDPRTLSE